MKNLKKNPAEYIEPLNMNGLQGRMLLVPARNKDKKRDILVIYGHHATLEKWWALAHELTKYGTVTMPDLPGFGGMRSLYKIGERPTLDRLADYVASFIKLRYKRRRLSIVGMGFGFVVVTRMLQRYPDLAKKVDLVVSLGGFAHYDDFSCSAAERRKYRRLIRAMSWRLPAWGLQYTNLPTDVLAHLYKSNATNAKLRKLGAELPARPVDAEVVYWRSNDLRTHLATVAAMLGVDNCTKRVALPVWHVPLPGRQYLNEHMTEQHMQVAFEDFHLAKPQPAKRGQKADAISSLLPPKLRRAFARARH